MEGKGSYSSIRFSLAGLFLIIGHASAGGYGSFGSFGGASAVSSASASASSSSTSNSWQGGAQLGPGSHGSGAVAGGNPLISNSVKGAGYDVDFNKFSDDLSGIKQGIAGLVGEVLGSVKQFNENIHGGGSALDGGCKTGNCGKNIFLIPGLSGGNHGGAGGSYGFDGSFGEANAGANSFAGATAPFGIGLNKNCGGPLCNNDAGNVRLHSQAPHQPKCSSPSCSQGNNAQTGQGIFPGSATPVHKVQRYPTTSSKPLPIQPQSCNGPFCRDSKNYGGINNYPSGIIPPQKVHSNPSSPKHPSSCRGPACQKNNKSPSIDRPHKANTPSAIASVHFVNSNPTSQTNISPAYLPPCNGPYCISGPNPHNPGTRNDSLEYLFYHPKNLNFTALNSIIEEKLRKKRSKRHSKPPIHVNENPIQWKNSNPTQDSYPCDGPDCVVIKPENNLHDQTYANPLNFSAFHKNFHHDELSAQRDSSQYRESPLKYISSAQKTYANTKIDENYHQSTSEIPSYSHNSPHNKATFLQHTASDSTLAQPEKCYGPACHQIYQAYNAQNIKSVQSEYPSNHKGREQYSEQYHQSTSHHTSTFHSPVHSKNHGLSSTPEYLPSSHRNSYVPEIEPQTDPSLILHKYDGNQFPNTSHHTLCEGQDCKENNEYENPYYPNYSANHEKKKVHSPNYTPTHEERSYRPYFKTTRRPRCNGPVCEENDSDKNSLELGTSDNPPGSIYEVTGHDIDRTYHPPTTHHSPYHDPNCSENTNERRPYKPQDTQNRNEQNYNLPSYPAEHKNTHYPSHPPTTRRPRCNGPACKENDNDKNSLELGTSDNPPGSIYEISSHDGERPYDPSDRKDYERDKHPNYEQRKHHSSNNDRHYKAPYSTTTRRPRCNGPACEENDSDKNSLELGTSDNPPGSIYEASGYDSVKHNHPSYDENDSPCYGPHCSDNPTYRSSYQPDYPTNHKNRNHNTPSYPYNHQRRYHPTYTPKTHLPPCNGPVCSNHYGYGDSPPSYYPDHPSKVAPPQHSSNYDPEYHHYNNNNSPQPGIPPNPPKHFTPNVHPPCNGPNCGEHTNGKNPFLPDPTGTNPQNGPGDWHPVFNPNPNTCFGPRCSAKKPPNQSCSGYQCNNNQPDLPQAANNRKYPNDECKLPHCNPYSTTGCPGPYCNSPEYANPGCASGNCGPKHNPIPGCAGPNCGRGQHQKPCAGPQCSGGPHANGEVEACSGPNCRGNYQQTPACTGPGCNGVIQVIPQNPPNHAPARPGCTDGSCLPKRPNVGPKPPIVFPQDDSDKSDWLPVQKPNPELDEHSPLNVGCNTGTCDGDGKGSGGFSSADASSSSTANAGSGGHGGSGPGSYGNSFSNSFATASASASASAHSGNYGR